MFGIEIETEKANPNTTENRMGELKETEAYDEELIDYEEEDERATDSAKPAAESGKKLVSILFVFI